MKKQKFIVTVEQADGQSVPVSTLKDILIDGANKRIYNYTFHEGVEEPCLWVVNFKVDEIKECDI